MIYQFPCHRRSRDPVGSYGLEIYQLLCRRGNSEQGQSLPWFISFLPIDVVGNKASPCYDLSVSLPPPQYWTRSVPATIYQSPCSTANKAGLKQMITKTALQQCEQGGNDANSDKKHSKQRPRSTPKSPGVLILGKLDCFFGKMSPLHWRQSAEPRSRQSPDQAQNWKSQTESYPMVDFSLTNLVVLSGSLQIRFSGGFG